MILSNATVFLLLSGLRVVVVVVVVVVFNFLRVVDARPPVVELR